MAAIKFFLIYLLLQYVTENYNYKCICTLKYTVVCFCGTYMNDNETKSYKHTTSLISGVDDIDCLNLNESQTLSVQLQ